MSAAEAPLVGILVGSESDVERMQPAVDELQARGIAHELEVRSAHRNPDAVAEYARTARERAYDGARRISFDGARYRTDIAAETAVLG